MVNRPELERDQALPSCHWFGKRKMEMKTIDSHVTKFLNPLIGRNFNSMRKMDQNQRL